MRSQLARAGALEAQPLLAAYRRPSIPLFAKLALYVVLGVVTFYYGAYYAATAPDSIMVCIAPLAVLILLVIWALPAGDYAPTWALQPLFVAFFTALIVWPNYLAVAITGLPWITVLRIIATPMVIALLISISSSQKFRTLLKEVLGVDPWIWRLLIALVAIQTFSIAMSGDPAMTLNRWLVAQINCLSIMIVACYLFLRPGFGELWMRLYLVWATVVCFLGLWENKLAILPWAGHIPPFLRIEDESIQRLLAGVTRTASGIHRVQSTATTPLGLAELLGLAIPFAVHIIMMRNPSYQRVLAGMFLPLAIWVIVLTDSRLGMVAALLSGVLYMLFWACLRWRSDRTSLIAPTIVMTYPATIAAVFTATLTIGRLRGRVWGNGSQSASDASRGVQWDMAIPKALEHPLGTGIGRGGIMLGFRNPAGVLTIDSYFISVLLELGIMGFIVYYGLMLRGGWLAARTAVLSAKDQEEQMLIPLSVMVASFIVVKSVFSQDANHPLVFMALGAILALTYRARKHNEPAEEAEPLKLR